MKEAGRTSVLSKRWRHLWVYIPTLNFDSSKLIYDLELDIKSLEVEVPKYLSWVDQVVSSHKAQTIDEFRVCFDIALNDKVTNSFDNWLKFALEKRVKRLEMDFSVYDGRSRELFYTFPSLSCNSLTYLELACVNVTGKILESFLRNCLSLECLSVQRSKSLVELKVVGPSLNLKSLRIYLCYNINQLEISAPNLVSICYFGPCINVQFQSTPKLVEVSIGYDYANDLINSFSNLSSYLSQIEVFNLRPSTCIQNIRISIKDPVFTRLTKMDLTIRPSRYDNLCFFGYLIKATF